MAYTRRFVGGSAGGAGSGTVTNTGNLTANHLVIGNGGVDESVLASLGTTTTVLHGNAAGAPTFAGVSLTADAAANQGTTTTLLHGNAAGQPTFAAVDLAADVGVSLLPAANAGVANIATAAQGYFMLPLGVAASLNQTATTAALTTNATTAMQIIVPWRIIITKATISVAITSNTNHFYVGLYSADKTTLLQQMTFTLGVGTGALSASALAPASLTLPAGCYWMTWGADNNTVTVQCSMASQTAVRDLFNNNNVLLGVTNQTIAAGVLPATVGTLTGGTNNVIPLVKLEP